MPDYLNEKAVLFYSLWSRPTLEFSQTCGKQISDGVDLLDSLAATQNYSNIVKVNWILAICFAGVVVICNTFNLFCCLLKPERRRSSSYRGQNIITSIIMLAFTITLLVLVSIAFGQVLPRYDYLQQWSDYAPCVDSYM